MPTRQDHIIEAAVEHHHRPAGIGTPKWTVERALNYAVLEHLESRLSDVTVGYGRDADMHHDQFGDPGWWDTFSPVNGTRFRVFAPSSDDCPDEVSEAMAAIGATPVGKFEDDVGTYDPRDRVAWHFVLPDNSPIHDAIEAAD